MELHSNVKVKAAVLHMRGVRCRCNNPSQHTGGVCPQGEPWDDGIVQLRVRSWRKRLKFWWLHHILGKKVYPADLGLAC